MISLRVVYAGSLVTVCLVLSNFAQEPPAAADPFSGEPAAVAPPEAKPKPTKKAEPEVVETDPNVVAIRESNPQTPFELMRAVENLINLGRPEEAKKYLKTLIDSKPNRGTLASLQQSFGSGIFFRLTSNEAMQPEGRPFAQAVLDAAYQVAHDPARIAALIKQLSDPSESARYAALVDLRVVGEDAAVALIQALADPTRAAERTALRRGLVGLGRATEGPAFAALESTNEDLRLQVLAVLTSLDTRAVVPFLLRPALLSKPNSVARNFAEKALVRMLDGLPTMGAAQRYLERETRAYFRGQLSGQADHEGFVTQWRWDNRSQRPIVERVTPRTASLRTAARLAGELTQLVPSNAEFRMIHVTAVLESSKLAAGWEQRLEIGTSTPLAMLSNFKPPDLEAVLEFAIKQEHLAAAVAALEIAGEMKSTEFISSSNGQPRILVQSLQHADRRVRFAALEAVQAIDPHAPFAGASLIPEAIASFARASGKRRVLVAHPIIEQAQSLVGLLSELGFEAEKALVGEQVLDLALQHSDVEIILLSDAIDRPRALDVLQQIRREPRLAKLPVGLLARQENFERMQNLVRDDRLVMLFPFPSDLPAASFLLSGLMARGGEYPILPDEALRQATKTLDFFVRLAAQPQVYGFYDLVSQESAAEQALATPVLTTRAAAVLGYLGTATAQQSLITLASQNDRDLVSREAAAKAFDTAVKRRGVLLTRGEILEQYDRYNASATADASTQQVLGSILDSIEAPSKTTSSVAELTGVK
jgi:HEAT repeat protein